MIYLRNLIPGTRLEAVADTCCQLATLTNEPVYFLFNFIEVKVLPRCTTEQVVKAYHSHPSSGPPVTRKVVSP